MVSRIVTSVNRISPPPPAIFVVLAAIAAIEGLALAGYAAFDAVEAVRVGATGPADVSNGPALVGQIVILAVFGAGLVFIGLGWWRTRRWPRAPFLLAQLIALVIGVPLASAAGGVVRVVGIAMVVAALAGIVLVFSPTVTKSFTDPPVV